MLAKRLASRRSSFSVTACSMIAARSPSGTAVLRNDQRLHRCNHHRRKLAAEGAPEVLSSEK